MACLHFIKFIVCVMAAFITFAYVSTFAYLSLSLDAGTYAGKLVNSDDDDNGVPLFGAPTQPNPPK